MPVRIHPFFWLGAVLLNVSAPPLFTILWVAAVLLCIVIHELGHAVSLRGFGYHPWIVLHMFGGLTMHNPGQPAARRMGPLGQLIVSMAGPATGFLLAGALLLVLTAAGLGGRIEYYDPLGLQVPIVPMLMLPEHKLLMVFLYYTFQITILWGVLNLLPVYPLDGGQIARQLFALVGSRDAEGQSLRLSIVTAVLLAFLAITRWNAIYMGVFFGYLAFSNYTMLRVHQSRWS
jgi:Zn-dependent protease